MNVLLFLLVGYIIDTTWNAPGCMNDSQVSELQGIYIQMNSFYENNGWKVDVYAFRDKSRHKCVIKLSRNDNDAEDPSEINRKRQSKSFRKATEWEMRMFQGCFRLIRDILIYEENGEQKVWF